MNVIVLGAAVLLAMLVAAGAAHPGTLAFIESSGVNIPTESVAADYGWGLVWAAVLLLTLFAWPVALKHKKMLAGAWLVKCFTALVLMLPYEEHYWGLDCWTYFRNSHMDTSEMWTGLLRGGTDTIPALGALLLKVQPDSYHAMKLTFGMFGLAAIFLFYRAAENLLERPATVAFWSLLFYPSILFWSSILGKDPAVLLGIALHVWGLVKMTTQTRPRYLVAAAGGILLASAVRVWLGPILLVPSLLVIVFRLKAPAWKVGTICVASVAFLALGSATVERFSLQNTSSLIEATRSVTDGFTTANSSLQRTVEFNSVWDFVLFTPQGLFDTYFRPLPGDVQNAFGWIAGFENLALLLLALGALLRFRLRAAKNSMFLWAVGLLVTWGLAYSLFTYRDQGTAVRFKLQILPVLLGLIGYLLRPNHTQRGAV